MANIFSTAFHGWGSAQPLHYIYFYCRPQAITIPTLWHYDSTFAGGSCPSPRNDLALLMPEWKINTYFFLQKKKPGSLFLGNTYWSIQKSNQCLPVMGIVARKGMRILSGVIKTFYSLTGVVMMLLHKFVKTQWIMCFKWVILCKLYLKNKGDLKI